MSNAFFKTPIAVNEAVKEYKIGSIEREKLLNEYRKMNTSKVDIPMYIGDEKVYTEKKIKLSPPHDHQHVIGSANIGNEKDVENAINSALEAKEKWSSMNWEHRAAIFLKAVSERSASISVFPSSEKIVTPSPTNSLKFTSSFPSRFFDNAPTR